MLRRTRSRCLGLNDDGKPAPEDKAGAESRLAGPVRLTYRRLAYGFETTIRKIYEISELEPLLKE